MQRAADDVEARDASLVGGCAYFLLVDVGQARHVGDALELGRALRRRDGAVPRDRAALRIDREQPSAGGADEQAAARHGAARGVAHRQRRIGALIDPQRLAVRGGKAVDPSVAGEHDDDLVRNARRRDHLARNARRPQRLAVGVEREHLALVGADDDERFAGPGPGGRADVPALTRHTDASGRHDRGASACRRSPLHRSRSS